MVTRFLKTPVSCRTGAFRWGLRRCTRRFSGLWGLAGLREVLPGRTMIRGGGITGSNRRGEGRWKVRWLGWRLWFGRRKHCGCVPRRVCREPAFGVVEFGVFAVAESLSGRVAPRVRRRDGAGVHGSTE